MNDPQKIQNQMMDLFVHGMTKKENKLLQYSNEEEDERHQPRGEI